MKILYLLLLIGTTIILCISGAFGQNPKGSGKAPTLLSEGQILKLLKDIRSKDNKKSDQAEQNLMRAGLQNLPAIERLAARQKITLKFVAFYNDLTTFNEEGDLRQQREDAAKALNFFAQQKAVDYLLLGLKAPILDVQSLTAEKLQKLVPTDAARQRAVVKGILDWLQASQSRGLVGSEDSSIISLTRMKLINALAEMAGLEPPPAVSETEGLEPFINSVQQWLVQSAQRRE